MDPSSFQARVGTKDWAYMYPATCYRVVDGDTLEVDLDLGFKTTTRQTVRLFGIDTCEVFGVARDTPEFEIGLNAAREVAWLLRPYGLGRGLDRYIEPEVYSGAPAQLRVETIKDRTGKYGRFLVNVWVEEGSVFLNRHLVSRGFAQKSV